MTRIHSIETIVFDLPTIRPHKLAMATVTAQSLILVRIRDENGNEGLGEASVIPRYGAETIEAIQVVINQYLAPPLIGMDTSLIRRVLAMMDATVKGNSYAKAAVEMACVDLAARALGVPASTLLGGAVHDRLPVLLVLSAGKADEDIALAQEMLDKRLHNRFLVKLGKDDPRDDVARAIAVKNALGGDVRVHADANQGWDEASATWAIERLQDGGIAVVEQPLPTAEIDGMRRLTERFTIPIMADEAIDTVQSALAFASVRAADAFSIKVTKHGGLLRTRDVASVAEAAGLTLFGGTMLESSVGTAAYAQVFSTVQSLDWGCQLFGPLLFADTITEHQPVYRDFHLEVPHGPGFGMRIDEDKLSHYRRDSASADHMTTA
ncbi:muconate cycloisomerase family protein [Subtercola boreus]|nr:muconate cycloisomerase family protein [Subtercola boreus]